MCNEKILGPFEENESEKSKEYREKRGALKDATIQVEKLFKEASKELAEIIMLNLKNTKETSKSIEELIKSVAGSKVTFSAYDEFSILVIRGNAFRKLSTNFKKDDEDIENIVEEIRSLRKFIKSRAIRVETLKIASKLKDALENLEEAFIEFAEL